VHLLSPAFVWVLASTSAASDASSTNVFTPCNIEQMKRTFNKYKDNCSTSLWFLFQVRECRLELQSTFLFEYNEVVNRLTVCILLFFEVQWVELERNCSFLRWSVVWLVQKAKEEELKRCDLRQLFIYVPSSSAMYSPLPSSSKLMRDDPSSDSKVWVDVTD
jgi:hypothetical protein